MSSNMNYFLKLILFSFIGNRLNVGVVIFGGADRIQIENGSESDSLPLANRKNRKLATKTVHNQGQCGNCYAHSIATTVRQHIDPRMLCRLINDEKTLSLTHTFRPTESDSFCNNASFKSVLDYINATEKNSKTIHDELTKYIARLNNLLMVMRYYENHEKDGLRWSVGKVQGQTKIFLVITSEKILSDIIENFCFDKTSENKEERDADILRFKNYLIPANADSDKKTAMDGFETQKLPLDSIILHLDSGRHKFGGNTARLYAGLALISSTNFTLAQKKMRSFWENSVTDFETDKDYHTSFNIPSFESWNLFHTLLHILIKFSDSNREPLFSQSALNILEFLGDKLEATRYRTQGGFFESKYEDFTSFLKGAVQIKSAEKKMPALSITIPGHEMTLTAVFVLTYNNKEYTIARVKNTWGLKNGQEKLANVKEWAPLKIPEELLKNSRSITNREILYNRETKEDTTLQTDLNKEQLGYINMLIQIDGTEVFSGLAGWVGVTMFNYVNKPKPNNYTAIPNKQQLEECIKAHIHGDLNSCNLEEYGPIEEWNVSQITDMSGLFNNYLDFNADISLWDTSNVTTMSKMFSGVKYFNADISSWDTSNVTDMSSMFNLCSTFNQDIGLWNVSNVTNMSSMFYGADSFNKYVGDWKVSNVKDMSNMFTFATAFDQDISRWNVSNVTNMHMMFLGATSFNQKIGRWEVQSNVTEMSYMFACASNFDPENIIDHWDLTKVTDLSEMLIFTRSSSNLNLYI